MRKEYGLAQPYTPGIAYSRTLYPMEYTLAWTRLYSDLIWTSYSKLGLKRPMLEYTRVYIITCMGQFIPRGIL